MTTDQIRVLIGSYLGIEVPDALVEEIEGFYENVFNEGYSEGYKDAEDYYEPLVELY